MRELDSFDSKAEATVQHLRMLGRTALLQYALAVGRHLIDVWFDGEIQAYRDRTSSLHVGFQRLLDDRRADLADLNLSASTLRNYMLADVTWRELPVRVRERLELTHLYRLAKVVDPIARVELAHEAAERGWATRQLEAAIQDRLDTERLSRPRPPMPEEVRAWQQVFHAVRKAAEVPGNVGALPLGHRHVLRREVEASLERLQALHKQLVD